MNKINKWAIEFHTQYNNQNVPKDSVANILWGFLNILEKFSDNNFNIKYKHIHKGWDVVHLFAIKS